LVFPSDKPGDLGSYWNVSLLCRWKDIANIGLDLFASGALGFLGPNDEAISYPFGPNGESVPVLGLASADVGGDTPFFVFVGGRYRLPLDSDAAPKFGFEYNHASRYWISFAQPTSNLTNKLANRGHAYEAYYLQPLNDALYTRLSYQFIDTRYTGGFFGGLDPRMGGTSPPVDQHLHAISLVLDASF
ncbi:MAG TPA: DUF3373 family protein, partial [Polyangiaceae bacterium]|nr:DUF3373 family protein [Polyangiaceae bacterium]